MIRFDASDLIDNIEAIINQIEQQVVDVAAKVTLDATADLVAATPVDTGRARQGWQAETPTKLGDQGHIINDVLYIDRLNAGHSKQAPAGFIESVVQKYNGGAV